ncbi:MAG: acyl carrier protein [Myxococcota bacterium]|nr:acyl carrier protein [Myxococcota bacterium]
MPRPNSDVRAEGGRAAEEPARGPAEADARRWTPERLTALIHGILRDELLAVGDEFTPSSDLVASGLDSLAVTQLMLSIEEATGVWVDESLLTPENLETSETLAACVHAHVVRDDEG